MRIFCLVEAAAPRLVILLQGSAARVVFGQSLCLAKAFIPPVIPAMHVTSEHPPFRFQKNRSCARALLSCADICARAHS